MIFRVEKIFRHPVKSMQGEALQSAELSPGGIYGDRRWALVLEASGKVATAKRFGVLFYCSARMLADGREAAEVEITLPDGATILSSDADVDGVLSDLLREQVKLVASSPQAGGPFFDAYPLNVLTQSSIRHLQSRLPGLSIDHRRFRPNILLEDDGDATGPVEFDWVGRKATIGAAELEIDMECPRCVMATRDQPELEDAPEIMRCLTRELAQNLSVYAVVQKQGVVRVGDVLKID